MTNTEFQNHLYTKINTLLLSSDMTQKLEDDVLQIVFLMQLKTNEEVLEQYKNNKQALHFIELIKFRLHFQHNLLTDFRVLLLIALIAKTTEHAKCVEHIIATYCYFRKIDLLTYDMLDIKTNTKLIETINSQKFCNLLWSIQKITHEIQYDYSYLDLVNASVKKSNNLFNLHTTSRMSIPTNITNSFKTSKLWNYV